jgi:hypothetical protein
MDVKLTKHERLNSVHLAQDKEVRNVWKLTHKREYNLYERTAR